MVPNTCEWAGSDGNGGVPTSLDVMVAGRRDDAKTRWQLASTGGTEVMFDGVGDQAEHVAGYPDLMAIKGDLVCGLTTFRLVPPRRQGRPPAGPAVTTRMRRLSPRTTARCATGSSEAGIRRATLVAAAIASAAPGSPAASIAIPAVGGTFGTGFPLPVGVDCTGAHVTTSLDGSPQCATVTGGDPRAVYPFYLQTLPADGYTIHVERDGIADDGTEIASIMFGGNGAGDESTVDVRGLNVTITLVLP